MIKYNNTNNASTTLTAGISASSTTLIVENGDILPAVPFLLTLEHFDNEKVTVREIVKCIAKADNILTIQRGAGTCVQDDSASTKEQGNSAHSFSVGDCASIYWTSEQVQDIQNEIEKKLNINDFQAGTYVYGATSTGTDAYSITIPGTLTSYSVGQVFRFMADVDNEGNATLNINGLGAVEIRKNHDKILDNGDIEAGQIVEVAFDGTYFQMDSQVATVVDLGNINSLKESGVVGEDYVLEDEIDVQVLEEPSYPFIVSYAGKSYEEFHIQRIANGNVSDKISLYLHTIGTSLSNVTIEIRKGIFVQGTNEEYWYGDENNIIATKTIAFNDLPKTLSKIDIVFDENMEFTQGDLLDIVLYQSVNGQKITDNSNYIVVGCYSNKYGGGYTGIDVTGTTRTKQETVCYCQSDAFFDKIFCKSQVYPSLPGYETKEISDQSGQISPGGWTWGFSAADIQNDTGETLIYNITAHVVLEGYGNINIRIHNLTTDQWESIPIFEFSSNQETDINGYVELPTNCTATILCGRGSDVGFSKFRFSNIHIYYPSNIDLLNNNKHGMFEAVYSIGDLTNIIVEGDVNGKWYSQGKYISPEPQIFDINTSTDLLFKYGGYVRYKRGTQTGTPTITNCGFTKTLSDPNTEYFEAVMPGTLRHITTSVVKIHIEYYY